MAQLLLIGSGIVNEPYNYLNDIVGIYHDSHSFSEIEYQQFDVLYVNGSREDVESKFDQIKPRIAMAYYWTMEQEWRFQFSVNDANTIKITVWYDPPNRWRELVNDFKFLFNVGDLTTEEKQALATLDINHPSVDAYVRKMFKDITSDPANQSEIRDLRSLEP